jgi:hypothetical protein
MNEDETKKVEADAATLWMGGADIESLIKLMRERGFNQRRSSDALTTVTGMSSDEARVAVLESETWRDQYERNLLIEDELAQALLELSRDESSGIKVVLEEEVASTDPKTILRRRRVENQ